MTFQCPNHRCTAGVSLGDARCLACGQSLAPLKVFAAVVHGWWNLLVGFVHTRCPDCWHVLPLAEPACPKCGRPVTLNGAVGAATRPTRRRTARFIRNLTPEGRRRMRWSYLALSALVFWALIFEVQREWTPKWIFYAPVCVVYIAMLYLFFLWLVPRSLRTKVGRTIKPATKFAALFNFFSLIAALSLFVANYWGQASKIALMFAIAFAGFFFFALVVRDLWLDLAIDWVEPKRSFSHLDDQGRAAYWDHDL